MSDQSPGLRPGTRGTWATWDLTPLRHPLFWSALAVLLVNDNWFKGRGVVPGWLTGKLSDFAFLVVAPVVCAALLPKVLPLRRTLALSVCVGLFVATELSPAFTRAFLGAVAQVGLHWRLWLDPTDLLALTVLPCTLYLWRSRHDVLRILGIRHRAYERVGLAIGVLACLATSAPPMYVHHPFFVNRTTAPVDVRVTWVLSKVDCAADPAELASTLTSSDLEDPRSVTVEAGQVMVLDGPPAGDEVPVGECRTDEGGNETEHCVAALIEAGDAQPALMVAAGSWWETSNAPLFGCSDTPEPRSTCQPVFAARDRDPGSDAVVLTAKGDKLQGTRGPFAKVASSPYPPADLPKVRIADVAAGEIKERRGAADGCRELRDEYQGLLSSVACARDEDCVEVQTLPIESDDNTCTTYLEASAAMQARALGSVWSERCSDQRRFGCSSALGICLRGSCTTCPGRRVPCPQPCVDTVLRADAACVGAEACLNNAGDMCRCQDRKWVCGPVKTGPLTCEDACIPLGPAAGNGARRANGSGGVSGSP